MASRSVSVARRVLIVSKHDSCPDTCQPSYPRVRAATATHFGARDELDSPCDPPAEEGFERQWGAGAGDSEWFAADVDVVKLPVPLFVLLHVFKFQSTLKADIHRWASARLARNVTI